MLIKIVFVVSGLSTGGAELMLLKLLKNIDRSRFSPYVFSLTDSGEVAPLIASLGIPVEALEVRKGVGILWVFLTLLWRIHRIKPDVVQTWMYHADFMGGLAAKICRVPHIVWGIRNTDLSPLRSTRTTRVVVRMCAFLSKLIPRSIVTCSEIARDVHISLGYEADRFEVIPNGFSLESYRPNAGARVRIREALGLAPATPLIGLIARFDSQKNHKGFLVAAKRVHNSYPDVHFLLAGKLIDSGNYVLSEAIRTLKLDENVHLLGRRDDIPEIMASLDILASSSFGEAFPNVLGEAMACGVLCAVTDAGDSSYIVGDTGRVVAIGDMDGLADSILDLLALPQEHSATLRRRARARVGKLFDIRAVTCRYEELYERLMN
jgi:glycosyltransferase involved in cell wall biosynthesis